VSGGLQSSPLGHKASATFLIAVIIDKLKYLIKNNGLLMNKWLIFPLGATVTFFLFFYRFSFFSLLFGFYFD